MTRRFSVLLLLTVFVMSLVSVSAFAAKANKVDNASFTGTNNIAASSTGSIREARVGGDDDPYAQPIGKPGNSSVMQSLGFQAAAGVVSMGRTTRYDLVANQTLQRGITLGCSGRIHAVWADLQVSASRVISGASYIPGSGITNGDNLSPAGGGFAALTVTGTGVAIAAWHRVAAGGTLTGLDFGCGAMSMTESSLYPDNVAAGASGYQEANSNYIWPGIATDLDASGNWFVHVIAHESVPTTAPVDTSGYQSLVYWRSQNNSMQAQGANAILIDSVSGITGCVVAHPSQGDQRVAVIYGKPRVYTPYHLGLYANDNVGYRESTNLGATWGPVQTIYNYAATQEEIQSTSPQFERAWETSGLYGADGCLHVLFQSTWSDTGATFTGDGGYILIFPAKIYHWDDCTDCATLVTESRIAAATCTIGGVSLRDVAKVNIAECAGKLYAVYSKSMSTEGDEVLPDFRDCSAAGFTNFEIFVKASSTAGATWGPDSNVTNTHSNNCAAGACFSELHMGTNQYASDSLRILYLEDKDAGVNVNTNGAATDSPIKVLSLGCFNMATFTSLQAVPASIGYPLNVPTGFKDTTIVVTNFGNISTPYTVAQTGGFITFPGGTNYNCPAGCTGSNSFVARINAGTPNTYASGSITITYTSPDKAPQAVITIPVERWSMSTFALPQDVDIRTSCNRINVNQASEIGDNVDGKRFSYFSDGSNYLYDGFLILGNSAANLSYSTFNGAGSSGLPSVSNPYGFLYAASTSTTYDSTTFGSYRYATGTGYNRDTTLGFKAEYYAPKHPDSCDFYVLVFKIYKGPKNPTGTVSGLTVGYYVDWDVPADTGSDNWGGADAAKQMLYQRGSILSSPAGNDKRYGAIGAKGNNEVIRGGMIVDNPTYIYPEVGWENDSLWNRMQGIAANEYEVPTAFADGSGTWEDLSMALVLGTGKTINGASNDTVKYAVVVAGTPATTGSLANAKIAIDKGYKFICDHNLVTCVSTCKCGDADNNGLFTISDAVFLINYIFAGGAAPAQPCLGDADGNSLITISDAVYLINYIFAGGPAPHCP